LEVPCGDGPSRGAFDLKTYWAIALNLVPLGTVMGGIKNEKVYAFIHGMDADSGDRV
jgi:hypothetical protein